jgi:hypothetical protein
MQSSNIIEVFEKAGFGKFRNPKVIFANNQIILKQRPFIYEILLFIFWGIMLSILIQSDKDYKKPFVTILFSLITLLFFWRAFSLRRIKIDLNEKLVYRSNLNPFALLIEKFLQHPLKIPFTSISGVYWDSESFRANNWYPNFYIVLKTTDPYKLKIAKFRKKENAESFSNFIQFIIKSK